MIIYRTNDKLTLPDHTVGGISLTNGKLVGLSNMVRSEAAVLDKRWWMRLCDAAHNYYYRTDKMYLTFTMVLTNIEVSYCWERKHIR